MEAESKSPRERGERPPPLSAALHCVVVMTFITLPRPTLRRRCYGNYYVALGSPGEHVALVSTLARTLGSRLKGRLLPVQLSVTLAGLTLLDYVSPVLMQWR